MSEHNPSLNELSDYFLRMAGTFYTNGPEGETFIPAPTNTNDPSGTLTSFYDEIIKPTPFSESKKKGVDQLQSLTREELETVQDVLESEGLENFTFSARGGSSICFRSRDFAVRVGPAPMGSKVKKNERALVREFCPLVLQPSITIKTDRSRVMFEVMPFVLNLRNGRVPEAFSETVVEVFENTAFNPADEDKDLGVLPDGTLVYLDPDAVYLKDQAVEPTQHDFDLIRENARKAGWPDELAWVTNEGLFKQSQFYPMRQGKGTDLII
jgi:hypothetical protein